MLKTWFSKKAVPVRMEVKRRSIRLYPPMPDQEDSGGNIVCMPSPTPTEELARALAEEAGWQPGVWDRAIAS